jgi:heat shock protein HslJ
MNSRAEVLMRRSSLVCSLLSLVSFCLLAALSASAQTFPSGRWLAEDILSAGVIDTAQTTLEFSNDGRVAGRGACNRYFGSVKIEGERISFSQIGSTRMACAPAVMDQEAKFFKALEAARSWRVEPASGRPDGVELSPPFH